MWVLRNLSGDNWQLLLKSAASLAGLRHNIMPIHGLRRLASVVRTEDSVANFWFGPGTHLSLLTNFSGIREGPPNRCHGSFHRCSLRLWLLLLCRPPQFSPKRNSVKPTTTKRRKRSHAREELNPGVQRPNGPRQNRRQETSNKSAGQKQQPRPRNNVLLQEQKLSQEMIDFLNAWEKETAKHKRLSAEIQYYEYNDVFFVESRGTAELRFEGPDKASFAISPQKIKEGDRSSRQDKDKNDYQLKSVQPERWVCTGKEIFQINDQSKTFKMVPIPPKLQGERINEGPIPFLFGLKADEAKKRYHFYKIKETRPIPDSFWFVAIPRREIDRQEYKAAKVILNIKTFTPIAISLKDPTGNTERSYFFTDVKVNPKQFFLNFGDFIKPDLKGYKWVGNANGNAPPPNGKQPPAQQPLPGRIRIGEGEKNVPK